MAIVKKYNAEVAIVNKHPGDVYTVGFLLKEGKFRFNPGQFLHLSIDQDYDGANQWPDSRCFSIQSKPDDDLLKITYSVKGKYTSLMKEFIKPGAKVWLKMPFGNLFDHPHNKVDTVFIAGGTGITPFLSLFSHSSFQDYINPRIYLGFKSNAYNIYNELSSLIGKNVHIYYENVEGLLDIRKIFAENKTTSDYFISGPPSMIRSFKRILIEVGLPADQILSDEWE